MSRRPPPHTFPLPRAVFIDSSVFYVLVDQRQDEHQDATKLFDALIRSRARIVTTNFILAESHALILGRTKRPDKGRDFLVNIYNSKLVETIWVTKTDEQKAVDIISRYQDKEWSFTDATSFVVMEKLGISHALSLDPDFNQYGFVTVPLKQ